MGTYDEKHEIITKDNIKYNPAYYYYDMPTKGDDIYIDAADDTKYGIYVKLINNGNFINTDKVLILANNCPYTVNKS